MPDIAIAPELGRRGGITLLAIAMTAVVSGATDVPVLNDRGRSRGGGQGVPLEPFYSAAYVGEHLLSRNQRRTHTM